MYQNTSKELIWLLEWFRSQESTGHIGFDRCMATLPKILKGMVEQGTVRDCAGFARHLEKGIEYGHENMMYDMPLICRNFDEGRMSAMEKTVKAIWAHLEEVRELDNNGMPIYSQ